MRFLSLARPSAPPPRALIDALEGRRLLSTTVAYALDADDPAAASTAEGVTALWSGDTLTLSGLPAHQMVHVEADLAAGTTATVTTAGRTSTQIADASGATTTTAGVDGWIADGAGTLTVALGAGADLDALTVRLHASDLTVQAVDDTISAGQPGEVLVMRSMPETLDAADASEPAPAVTLAVSTGGTATEGEDYDDVGQSLQMAAGVGGGTILVNPHPEGGGAVPETVTLELMLDEMVEAETITLLATVTAPAAAGGSVTNPLTLPGAGAGGTGTYAGNVTFAPGAPAVGVQPHFTLGPPERKRWPAHAVAVHRHPGRP